MTEKRFYYAHGLIFDTHKDNHINKIGTIKDLDIGLRIVNWLNELNDENEQLKSRVDYLERKIQRERASAMKQHEKWEKEIKDENEQLKSVIKEVTELLSDEVDLFSDKATEHDIIAYVELKELDNKDAYYMATATKKAIRMLKELLE